MTITASYFTAGGTLHPESPSYVPRPTDDELLQLIRAGQFCYVLTSRQMGKSSLMERTADKLRQGGSHVAMVDLTEIGNHITADQWYLGIMREMAADLQLDVDVNEWYSARAALGNVQRLGDFVDQVVLPGRAGQLVIFLDEIDSTLSLPFTDDFFAAIRVFYNKRASNHDYARLVFVLLGVAAPSDLIKDRTRTPFNIGRAVHLRELSRSEAEPLARGLERLCPGRGAAVLDRIFDWTAGHPYLTQRLCLKLSEQPARACSHDEVDALVDELFFSQGAEQDSNLDFVRDYLAARDDRGQLLQLYERVYRGEAVAEDERSPFQNRLKLVGLVRSERGVLVVRNRIYRRIFGPAFIHQLRPRNWLPLGVGAAVLAVLLAVVAVVSLSRAQEEQRRVANLANIAGLCGVAEAEGQRSFFSSRNPAEQLDMFAVAPGAADASLLAVASCVGPAITASPALSADEQATLRAAICAALDRRGVGAGAPEWGKVGCP